MPGGALELGETLQQGVVREVLEETGIGSRPRQASSKSLTESRMEEATGRVRYHYVLVDFVCRVAGGTLLGASDAEEARWVERNELQWAGRVSGGALYRAGD